MPSSLVGHHLKGRFLYANDDLKSCDVDQYEITVRPGDRLISATASIQYPQPLGFRVLTLWSHSNHAMSIGSLSAGMFLPNTLAQAITDGLTNISGTSMSLISGAAEMNVAVNGTVDGTPNVRLHFSACQTGLHPHQRACLGLGLDLGVDQSPSPPIGLASRFDGLASLFARLAEKQACTYFSPQRTI
ncbi:hypothetical protein B0H14DRAFT_2658984 [Mycena olivaceomarginata]|nr:hypothetical protein B0H14DRAFT_2658984 [Mycena olivaceomarginata]